MTEPTCEGIVPDVTTCQYFALCENLADETVKHPVLGKVPACQRCADIVGAELVPFEETR